MLSPFLIFLFLLIGLFLANSSFSFIYFNLIDKNYSVCFFGHTLFASLRQLVNEGLMSFFFLVAALETKRELSIGHLRIFKKAVLPFCASIGGIVCPVLVFLLLTSPGDARKGWAIPIATDIALSLAVLSLVRTKVPSALYVLLTATAIFDDLGSMLVITFFSTHAFSLYFAALACVLCLILVFLARMPTCTLIPYLLLGVLLWSTLLISGLQPTVAGIVLGFCIPSTPFVSNLSAPSLIDRCLRLFIHPVYCFILPLFAFVNAGVRFDSHSFALLLSPVGLGTCFGLFLGKPIGILASLALLVGLGLGEKPDQVTWWHLCGMAMLGGVGFTLSLLLSQIAFSTDSTLLMSAKLGVLSGSLCSALGGLLCLFVVRPKHKHTICT